MLTESEKKFNFCLVGFRKNVLTVKNASHFSQLSQFDLILLEPSSVQFGSGFFPKNLKYFITYCDKNSVVIKKEVIKKE